MSFLSSSIRPAKEECLVYDVDTLRAENDRLREFVFRASHDLKSPLRAVIALAEWIVEDLEATFGKLPKNIISDLDEIAAQSTRMSKLISDLLDLSQIGSRDDERMICDPYREIGDCISLCSFPDNFIVSLDESFPAVICSPVEFSLMIRNLLSNSVEHHDQASGTIVIANWESDGFCFFRIRDDGPGIEEEHREAIFEMFKKLGPSKGSGIGLGMVRQIAEHYGGSASVAPNPAGRGSDFIISLPIATVETEKMTGVS